MSNRMTIDGPVSITPTESVAGVAYQMAKDLWYEEHGDRPKASDEKFFFLVRTCAMVLSNSGNGDHVSQWHAKTQ